MLHIGDRIGPYTLLSKLGSGSFGMVWLAERRTPLATTKLALKTPLDDELGLEIIKQEADLWARASGHPNVLPIYEANIYDNQAVIVSEYAPDGSLTNWLQKHGGAAPSQEYAVQILTGILSGLSHIHLRHIIHRDLKPANILFQGDTPRLTDFGISRLLKTTSLSSVVAGTPAYMAPEAFDGKRNEQTDIWSAGVIFYLLLVGRLPFPQTDMTSLLGAILNRSPEPLPSSIPASLQQVVLKALDKDVRRRYKTAVDMMDGLRHAVKGQKHYPILESIRTVIRPRASSPIRRSTDLPHSPSNAHRLSYTLLGFVIAIILVAVGVMLRSVLRNPSGTTSSNQSTPAQSQKTARNVLEPRSAQVPSTKNSATDSQRSDSIHQTPKTMGNVKEEVQNVLRDWTASLKAHDLETYLSFFSDPIETYHMQRGYGRDRLRAQMAIAFARYDNLDIELSNIQITPDRSGISAVCFFTKKWDFQGAKNYSGLVREKLWLSKVEGRWLITGIKDL